MHRVHRGTVPAVLAALLLLTACASTVSGTGTVASGASGSGSHDFPSSRPNSSPPTSSTSSSTSASTQPPADLPGLLLPPPAGSHPWNNAWARNTSPTVEEWVAEVYASSARADIVAQLRDQGVNSIAHRTWVAVDDNQADLVLLSFDSPGGAAERYDVATSAKSHVAGVTPFEIPGVDHAVGYADPKVDSLGNVPAIVYVLKGNVVVELFYYSAGRLRTGDAITWTQGQVSRLP
jgi:hypothetical protein